MAFQGIWCLAGLVFRGVTVALSCRLPARIVGMRYCDARRQERPADCPPGVHGNEHVELSDDEAV